MIRGILRAQWLTMPVGATTRVVERLCDRVAIIDRRRFVRPATVEELRASGESLQALGGRGRMRRNATIEVAERLCDRVAIIDRGRIVRSGTLDELRPSGESLPEALL